MDSSAGNPEAVEFEEFVGVIRGRLGRALVARFGVQIGVDLTAEVEGWAWENFEELRSMHNPLGYLYRVAQSRSRSHVRWNRRNSFPGVMPERGVVDESMLELHDMLAGLTENQRVCVLLVHAHGWTQRDVAATLGISTAAVGNHVTRGLGRLRGLVVPVDDPLLPQHMEGNRNER